MTEEHRYFEFWTLIEILQARAVDQPRQRAFSFLTDGEAAETHLTYKELDRRARALGATLQRLGCESERAIILCPPGLGFIEAFFGSLYAGAIAVPAMMPRPNRRGSGLESLVADARPKFVIGTNAQRKELAAAQFHDAPSLEAPYWLCIDRLDAGAAGTWRRPRLAAETVAYLQYTSGSTATPRGVMVSYRNLLANVRSIARAFQHPAGAPVVGWLPPYHDMGLVGNVITPICIGAPTILLSPMAFLQKPFRWLQAISRCRGASSGGPNFAYDLCVRRIKPEQRETLDLSSWTLAFIGSDPVRRDTLEAFARTFASCGFRREAFYPCYGLAEATVFVTGGSRNAAPVCRTFAGDSLERNRALAVSPSDDDAHWLVGCGHDQDKTKTLIVDPDTRVACPDGVVGEIWVSGSSVAKGYWNRSGATQQTFGAHLADTGAGPYLRTGDLGFRSDGQLFITGRRKDLIIIDGRNHYSHDIESVVERSHPMIRLGGCAAFSIDASGRESLVVVAEISRGNGRPAAAHEGQFAELGAGESMTPDSVVRSIRRTVSEHHDLGVYAISLVRPGAIPKTSSGKVRRHACRSGFLARSLEEYGRWTSGERRAAVAGASPESVAG
ncbi:MAG: fatty acyl-AMP ligase [Kiloniellaceae bacterium]